LISAYCNFSPKANAIKLLTRALWEPHITCSSSETGKFWCNQKPGGDYKLYVAIGRQQLLLLLSLLLLWVMRGEGTTQWAITITITKVLWQLALHIESNQDEIKHTNVIRQNQYICYICSTQTNQILNWLKSITKCYLYVLQ